MTDTYHHTLAGRLSHLITTLHATEAKPYSYRELSAAIAQHTGTTISAAYLHQLTTGARNNPNISYIRALADYFGVPPAYFFTDPQHPPAPRPHPARNTAE